MLLRTVSDTRACPRWTGSPRVRDRLGVAAARAATRGGHGGAPTPRLFCVWMRLDADLVCERHGAAVRGQVEPDGTPFVFEYRVVYVGPVMLVEP